MPRSRCYQRHSVVNLVGNMKTQDAMSLVFFGILFLVCRTQQGIAEVPRMECMPFGPRDCDPCSKATCPDFANRATRCENRLCGTCQAAFFRGNKEIKTCCNSDERCPDGTKKFQCLTNPCDLATCPAIPDAECRPNYCGGCKAEFFSFGSKVSDGFCIREECPSYLPQAKCAVRRKCMGETCPLVPGADCWIDGCNAACAVIFYKGRKRLTWEECNGCPMNDRVPGCVNPCDGAACPMHPNARCEPQTCGECKANFYGLDRKLIQYCMIDPGFFPPCPGGSRPFNCLVDPCTVNSCPGVRNSVCRANYCGGCKAEFYSSGMKLTEFQCNIQERCPGDLPVASCVGGLCDAKNCPMHSDAKCFVDGCNGCTAIFYKEGKRLTREDCFGCPFDKPTMDCGDICANAHCPLFPESRCEPRVCGECGVAFFGLDRRQIEDCCNSGGGGCPPGVNEHLCKVNPCDVNSCPAEPHAQCKPNYCGGCKAEFYKKGTKLSYEDCGLCSDGSEYINCGIVPPCRFDRCEAYPRAKCRSSNCGVCKIWFEDADGNVVDCKAKPKVTCKVPSRFQNGRISPDDRSTVNEGEFVYYKCLDGFVMKGKDMKKCVRRGKRGRLIGTNPRCIDVNECKKRPCDVNAKCINTEGSFTCTCKPGYSGDGKKCHKIEEPESRCPAPTYWPCTDDCDSSYECGYQRICCWNGCADRCVDISGICPNGDPPVQCYANPCTLHTCDRYPDATCNPNYCGGCTAEFFLGDVALSPGDCKKLPPCPAEYLNPVVGLKCIDACKSDADCKASMTCCHDGCGTVCRETSVPSCPTEYWTPNLGVICSDHCTSDADCSRGKVCCFDGCGKICRQTWYV